MIIAQPRGAWVARRDRPATRRDLLPPEFISELSRLQDDARGGAWADISAVLEETLGGPVTEKFASFDQEPIPAASIAQVHTAALPPGDQVVVKVRRPGATAGNGSRCRARTEGVQAGGGNGTAFCGQMVPAGGRLPVSR
jgi:ABC1 atypical kinase-like domain